MTNEQFERLTERLKIKAAKNPVWYKTKVLGLAVVGYVYLFLIIAILVTIIGALAISIYTRTFHLILFKLGLPGCVLLYVLLTSLWVRIPEPEGIILNRRNAPELLTEIERMRKELKGVTVHEVQLDNEFNAAIVQIPRLGVFGWYKNILIIGLPLMMGLSRKQFQAVVAHELGHLSGAHGRFGSWIYRVRRTWAQLLEQLEESQARGKFLFHSFLKMYAPYFNAYTYVLARDNEYEADRCMARIAGTKHAASALVSINVKAAQLDEEFWPLLTKQASHQPEPPGAYGQMAAFFDSPIHTNKAEFYRSMALMRSTDPMDTHPSLSERLKALRAEVEYENTEETYIRAHQAFLPNDGADFIRMLDQQWQRDARQGWQQQYEHYQALSNKLAKLEEQQASRPLSLEESLQMAEVVEAYKSPEAALPIYQDIAAREPSSVLAYFAIGRILTRQNREDGVDFLKHCMSLSRAAEPHACHMLFNFYMQNGQKELAREYLEKGQKASELLELQQKECDTISVNDTLLPERPEEAACAALRQELGKHASIEKAHILRKQATYTTDQHIYLVIIEFSINHTQQKEQILQEIANQTDQTDAYLFIEIDALSHLRSVVKKHKQPPLYDRKTAVKPHGTEITM